MFEGIDVSCNIHDLRCSAANAEGFNISETSTGGTKSCIIERVTFTASKGMGTVNKLLAVKVDTLTGLAPETGLVVLGGVTQSLILDTLIFISTSVTFVGLDLTGTTDLQAGHLKGSLFVGGAGSIGIKGDAANANVKAGFVFDVQSNQFLSVTTPLSGISVEDFRWGFLANGGLADSLADGLLSMTSNATETVISAVDTPTLVDGTFVVERTSHFTGTTGGRLTLNSERPVAGPIMASLTIDVASGTNKSIRAYLALNGTEITNSGQAVNITAGDPKQLTIPWQISLEEDDYLEIFVENETDAVNIIVIDATLLVR
jgi:hypothetical protein